MRVELEKIVPTSRSVVPDLWVQGVSTERIEAALEEIADELGISRQALASRLRRGHRQLIETTLAGP